MLTDEMLGVHFLSWCISSSVVQNTVRETVYVKCMHASELPNSLQVLNVHIPLLPTVRICWVSNNFVYLGDFKG